MDTDALTAGLLRELRATRPYPALSLTMPTHRTAPDNAQDPVRLRNLVAEAGHRLDADPQVSRETAAAIRAELDRAVDEVDPRRALDSLVVLATADEHLIWQLPRTAPERVVLSDSYLTRNLVAAKAQARPYWALTVAADHATLWNGTDGSIEVRELGGFPLTAPKEAPNPQREERIGDTPSTFTYEDTRNFFRTVDQKLRAVLSADPRPLYVMGLPPALALLDEVGESSKGAVGRVAKGAPADLPPADVLKELRPALEEGARQATADVGTRLDDARSAHTFAGGLDEVWAAVREGRVGLVAVESTSRRPCG
ncbi:Chemotaxis protein OS=Streptomyces microflavus OX=1919 GN=Smic_00060 PE=4 SV=1 [Streptomyces microflavus]